MAGWIGHTGVFYADSIQAIYKLWPTLGSSHWPFGGSYNLILEILI